MIQFHCTAVVFVVLSTVCNGQSAATAEEFNLKEDWERFYRAVLQSDVEQVLAIRDSLEPSQEELGFYVQTHSALAARLAKLDRSDAAVETLERALLTFDGGGPISDAYALAWSQALEQLCDALVAKGELKQIPTRVSMAE